MGAKKNLITMEHGAGGDSMQSLIADTILKNITNNKAGTVGLDSLDDGATVRISDGVEIVITTDSHVIKPIFFPDSDIGRLSVSGTINDLVVMGAKPIALTCSIILPEGFEIEMLEKIIKSMNEAALEVGVSIVTGDTKTIEKNGLDSLIINTTGIGVAKNIIRDCSLKVGDKIIVTGTLGDHGTSLLIHREGFKFDTELTSDVSPLWNLMADVLKIYTDDGKSVVSAMKDPTRGGLASTLNEMAQKSDVGVLLIEKLIPLKFSVRSACEMLGLDPLEIANEGKIVMGVKHEYAEQVIDLLKSHKYGVDAAIIGEVTKENRKKVVIKTEVGGMRYLSVPEGDPIPRVC
ncbi:MAG: hydrogenase expression/formation protein HypE [Methanosarcinaceae archaeon]|nr:hydrogenase expression/formation protein HypE [Methanosarcinaceae archaeon]